VLYSQEDDLGWSLLYRTALRPWIVLNVFRHFPDLLPSNSTAKSTEGIDSAATAASESAKLDLDYRRTATYQSLLEYCSQDDIFNEIHYGIFNYKSYIVPTPLSLEYDEDRSELNWGIEDTWLGDTYTSLQMSTSFTEYLAGRGDETRSEIYPPKNLSLADDVVDQVQLLCEDHHLPQEICLMILEYVQLEGETDRLPVKYDPLHPSNNTELDKYLQECCMIFVRCEMLAQELGIDIC
jgi:hypothetical protein